MSDHVCEFVHYINPDGTTVHNDPVCLVCGVHPDAEWYDRGPAESGVALDVERLERVLVAVIPGGTDDALGSPNDLARAIAREYAKAAA